MKKVKTGSLAYSAQVMRELPFKQAQQLLEDREKLTHDFISGLNEWLEEFNRVTDNIIKEAERLLRGAGDKND